MLFAFPLPLRCCSSPVSAAALPLFVSSVFAAAVPLLLSSSALVMCCRCCRRRCLCCRCRRRCLPPLRLCFAVVACALRSSVQLSAFHPSAPSRSAAAAFLSDDGKPLPLLRRFAALEIVAPWRSSPPSVSAAVVACLMRCRCCSCFRRSAAAVAVLPDSCRRCRRGRFFTYHFCLVFSHFLLSSFISCI